MIKYKSGYKYQLALTYTIAVNVRPIFNIRTKYIELTTKGILTIKSDYCWDGPSGPTIDTKNFMRGSLVHDAIYQLIRKGHLFMHARIEADKMLREMCIEDGMSRIRAWLIYRGVSWFGKSAALPENIKKIEVAP